MDGTPRPSPPRGSGTHRRAPRLLALLAVALLVLGLPSVPAAAPSLAAAPRMAGDPAAVSPSSHPALQVALEPTVVNRSASNYVVRSTLDLLNHTLVQGNLVDPVQCTQPTGVAFDATGTLLYVTCSVSNNVVVVDPTTQSVLRGIPVGSTPSAILFDPLVHSFYVANEGSDNVSVFAPNAVVPGASIAVGSVPVALAENSSGSQVFVCDTGSNSVAVVNASTNRTAKIVFGGFSPSGVAYDAALGEVYASDGPVHNVTVTNVSTGHLVTTLAVGSGPTQMIADPLTSRIYVSNSLSDNVSILDGGLNSVAGSVSLGLYPGALALDGVTHTLYVAEENSANVTVVDLNRSATNGSVAINGFPSALAWDPVHGRLAVDDQANTTADLVDVANRSVTLRISMAAPPGQIAFDPVTGEAYVALPTRTQVAVLHAATGSEWGTVDVGARPVAVGVDPTNGSVLVGTFDAYRQRLINGTSHAVVAMPYTPGTVTAVTYDPKNGTWFVPLYNPEPLALPLTGSVTEVVNARSLSDIRYIGIGWCFTVPDAIYDPANDTIFLLNADCSNVTVYDASNYALVHIFKAGLGPTRGVYDPKLNEVFISNTGTNNVSVVNASTYQVLRSIPVGLQPEGLAYDPVTDFLFVANSGSNDLMIINTTSDDLVADLPVGQTPVDVAVDPTDGTVLVTNSGSGTVSVVGPSPFTAVATTPSSPSVLLGTSVPIVAQALNASGSPLSGASFHWTVSPAWIGTLNSSTGSEVTFTAGTTVGSGGVWVNATFGPVVRGALVHVAVVPPALVAGGLTASPARFLVDTPTNLSVQVSGGIPPYQYAYAGLPPGCHGADAPSILCTPTQAGPYNVSATVHDSVDQALTQTVELNVTALAGIVVTPGAITLKWGTGTRLAATTRDGFGEPVGRASIAWTAVPGDLGAFNRSSGANVTFTATGYEPAGTIWANATYAGTTVSTEIPVNVTAIPASSAPSGPAVPLTDLVLIVVAAAIAVVAVVLVLRRRRRGPAATTPYGDAVERWAAPPDAEGDLGEPSGEMGP